MDQIFRMAFEFGLAVAFWGAFVRLSFELLHGIVVPSLERSVRRQQVPIPVEINKPRR